MNNSDQAKKGFNSVGDLLSKFKNSQNLNLPDEYTRDKYVSREFQKYGYDLASELGDLKNKSLYIKLAKTTPRVLLESARSFVKDAYNAKSKGRLFMWKLSELKKMKKVELQEELSEAKISNVEITKTKKRIVSK